MVDWKSFAQRRKLNLEDFVQRFSYLEFTNWCQVRGVVPPGSMAWQLKSKKEIKEADELTMVWTNPSMEPDPEPEIVVDEPIVENPSFVSMTKKELTVYCKEKGIQIRSNWSKQKIIKAIQE